MFWLMERKTTTVYQTSIKRGKWEGASQAQWAISYFSQAHLPDFLRVNF